VSGPIHAPIIEPCTGRLFELYFNKRPWVIYLGFFSFIFFSQYSSVITIIPEVFAFTRSWVTMHIPPATQLLAVLSLLLAEGTASPIAWPEEKLEAINVLRARGASEVRRLQLPQN